MDVKFLKYPRTRHIQGSGIQKGDGDMDVVPFELVSTDERGQYLVIEEKLDGANSGVSFLNGEPVLQSRGHTLIGGPRERQFDMFKAWVMTWRYQLYDLLGERFIMFGEWMYAKHSEFYDQLPHFFIEFDVFDRVTNEFLATDRRHRMFEKSPVISAPVLFSGKCNTIDDIIKWIGDSLYKSNNWKQNLINVAKTQHLDPDEIIEQTDMVRLAEGLYIKEEENGFVTGRYKFIRPDFTQMVAASEEHWMNRPLIPNQLAKGINIWYS